MPPAEVLFFDWTLENYAEVNSRSNYFLHFMNSVIISVGSTLLGLAIAIPAAWSMAFVPGKRTKDVLMWMLSTKMLPPVGVLIPIYLLFRDGGLLDTRLGLVIVLTLINLPIIVWMLFTYFKEIPGRDPGSGPHGWRRPVGGSGPRAHPHGSAGHCLDPSAQHHPRRNEASDPQPDGGQGGTAHGLHRQLFQPGGLFYAKLSAASTLAIAPILVLGWFSQKQLVRGLTFGAVK